MQSPNLDHDPGQNNPPAHPRSHSLRLRSDSDVGSVASIQSRLSHASSSSSFGSFKQFDACSSIGSIGSVGASIGSNSKASQSLFSFDPKLNEPTVEVNAGVAAPTSSPKPASNPFLGVDFSSLTSVDKPTLTRRRSTGCREAKKREHKKMLSMVLEFDSSKFTGSCVHEIFDDLNDEDFQGVAAARSPLLESTQEHKEESFEDDEFELPTFRAKKAKILDTRLSSADLAALKEEDPFMYYSIPAVKKAVWEGRPVDFEVSLFDEPVKRRVSISFDTPYIDISGCGELYHQGVSTVDDGDVDFIEKYLSST